VHQLRVSRAHAKDTLPGIVFKFVVEFGSGCFILWAFHKDMALGFEDDLAAPMPT
jgi:hypothetical protein